MSVRRISIVDKKLVAQNTWEFTFQCLDSRYLNIEAGQYMRIVIPEVVGGARENSRIFSVIMFGFRESKHFGVVFRESESVFKRHLISAPIGAELTAYGPFGDFVIPPCLDFGNPNMVWIAGGVGIAPFISMARYTAEKKLAHRILLLYANKDEQSAAYLDELTALQKENRNFTLRHKIGLLDEELICQNIEKFLSVAGCRLSDAIFYIAGPLAMTDQVKLILTRMGIAPSGIRTEIFGV